MVLSFLDNDALRKTDVGYPVFPFFVTIQFKLKARTR